MEKDKQGSYLYESIISCVGETYLSQLCGLIVVGPLYIPLTSAGGPQRIQMNAQKFWEKIEFIHA